MTDRELLQAAAKAAGIRLEWDGPPADWVPMYYEGKTYHAWEPLERDDLALRLAAKLGLTIEMPEGSDATAYLPGSDVVAVEWAGLDPDAMLPAVRRAVVRAAAALAPTPSDSSHA